MQGSMAVHLDHGTDFKQVMLCIRHGFSSVMVDASRFELENIISKNVVEIAHAVGVSVEAELER